MGWWPSEIVLPDLGIFNAVLPPISHGLRHQMIRGTIAGNRMSIVRLLPELARRTCQTLESASFKNLLLQCGTTGQGVCRRIGLTRDMSNFQLNIHSKFLEPNNLARGWP